MTGMQASATPRGMAPAPRPMRLPRLRRRMLVSLIVVGAVALVVFNVGRQAFVGWSIGQQAASLEAQVAAAEAANAALQRQLEYVQSDAYVTAEARRLRNLGYPGEEILFIPPGAAVPAPATAPTSPAQAPQMLERWIALFFSP